MELPQNSVTRFGLYRDIIRECELASQQDRRERHKNRKALLLTGTDTGAPARYNALKEWQGLSSSLVYNREGCRWGVGYPPYYGGKDPELFTNEDLEQALDVMREEFHRLWYDGASASVAADCVRQAHYADTTIAKLHYVRNEPTIDIIADPSDFCVLDESRRIDQQEAMVHFYSVSLPAFWRMLLAADLTDKKREELFMTAKTYAAPDHGDSKSDFMGAGAMQPLLIGATAPNMQGNVTRLIDTSLAVPQSKQVVAKLAELWIWDDRAGQVCETCRQRKEHWWHAWSTDPGHKFKPGDYCPDWRVVTQFVPTLDILYEPANPLGIDSHAFFPLQLDPQPGYAYGIAPMESLIPLQLWLNEKLGVCDWYDNMVQDPPITYAGIPGRDGEEMKGWRNPGANIPLGSNPNAKVEYQRPPMRPDEFAFVNKIMDFMYAAQGIPKAMRGLADQGMRSAEQPMAQAMLAAGPTLDRAMIVEDWLEAIGTAMLRCWRNVLDRPLVKTRGERFLLRQMPGDFVARVWAHSASPAYTENIVQKALVAKKEGMIDGPEALEFLGLPGTDLLRRKAAQLAESQAKRGQEVLDLKKKEAEAKVIRAVK